VPLLPRLGAGAVTARIGVTGVVRTWDGAARSGVNAAYISSVVACGGIPFVLSPLLGADRAADALDGLHGLLLTGGEDVDPALYAAAPSARLGTVSRERDDFELALLAAARDRQLPVLGICRGAQVINVGFGGTLWQDLPSERPGPVNHHPESPRDADAHSIRILPGSRAAHVLGRLTIEANSFHHQAIRELGRGLLASAWAGDELVEAVETTGGEPWLLAVQWHPEEMTARAGSSAPGLFRAFIAAAARYAGSVRAEVAEDAVR